MLFKISEKFHPPKQLGALFVGLAPLMLSQVILRFEPIIDTNFITRVNPDFLIIQSILGILLFIGQLIGIAGSTSLMIYWGKSNTDRKSQISTHVALTLSLSFVVGIIFVFSRNYLAQYFKLSADYADVSSFYLLIGALTMLSQSIISVLNTALIASDKRKLVLLILAIIVGVKTTIAFAATAAAHSHLINSSMAFYIMGASTLIINCAVAFLAFKILDISLIGFSKNFLINFREIRSVWLSEIGIALIRSTTPIINGLQLAMVVSTSSFFVTFQMTSSLAYALCLPYLSTVQIALRDAGTNYAKSKSNLWGSWLSPFLYLAFIPTVILLLIAATFPSFLYEIFLNFKIPNDHYTFIRLYFIGCIIGQVGNLFVIPLRALKQNWLVTKNFLLTEFFVQIILAQILIMYNRAIPTNFGFVTIIFCSAYLMINMISLNLIKTSTI